MCVCVCVGVLNFVTADGVKFAHPLHHLGKTKKVSNWQHGDHAPNSSPQDLPVLAIDSFRHMYLFPNYHQDIQ